MTLRSAGYVDTAVIGRITGSGRDPRAIRIAIAGALPGRNLI